MKNQPLNEVQVKRIENEENEIDLSANHEYHKYICEICNYIYDEGSGELNVGLAPGTLFEDIPEDWHCPECSALKSSFKFLE